MRRRTFLELALAGTPLLVARCAKAKDVPEAAVGYFGARPGAAPQPGITTKEPQRLGLASQRDGFFYAPPQRNNAPVLLFLHGATGSGEWAIQRFIDYANRTGTIILAPDSREHTWGVVLDDEGPDTRFLDLALDKIFKNCSVDAKRIAIGGFSDGASAALSFTERTIPFCRSNAAGAASRARCRAPATP